MLVLAVDTSTSRGSVALVDGEETLGEVRLATSDDHSSHVLPAAAFLLEHLGRRATDMDGFAVAVGPGSFTGLRIGISTVQGLALAAGRPCLGIPTLDVLAAGIVGSAKNLVAMVDAHRGEVYAALYDEAGTLRGERVAIVPTAFLSQLPAEAAFVGDGAVRYKPEIVAARPNALFPGRDLHLASILGRLAGPLFAAGKGVTPDALRPLYMRAADVRAPARPC